MNTYEKNKHKSAEGENIEFTAQKQPEMRSLSARDSYDLRRGSGSKNIRLGEGSRGDQSIDVSKGMGMGVFKVCSGFRRAGID